MGAGHLLVFFQIFVRLVFDSIIIESALISYRVTMITNERKQSKKIIGPKE